MLLAAGSAQLANAHTAFTNFFIDGENQGDGTAVRMNTNMGKTTFPINGITSPDMACGKYLITLLLNDPPSSAVYPA